MALAASRESLIVNWPAAAPSSRSFRSGAASAASFAAMRVPSRPVAPAKESRPAHTPGCPPRNPASTVIAARSWAAGGRAGCDGELDCLGGGLLMRHIIALDLDQNRDYSLYCDPRTRHSLGIR